MKKILLLFTIVFSAVLFSGCEKAGVSDNSESIIGTWDLLKKEYSVDVVDDNGHAIGREMKIRDYTSDEYSYFPRWIIDANTLSYGIKVDKNTGEIDSEYEEKYLYEIHENEIFLMGMKWAIIISLTKNELVIDQDIMGRMYFVKR